MPAIQVMHYGAYKYNTANGVYGNSALAAGDMLLLCRAGWDGYGVDRIVHSGLGSFGAWAPTNGTVTYIAPASGGVYVSYGSGGTGTFHWSVAAFVVNSTGLASLNDPANAIYESTNAYSTGAVAWFRNVFDIHNHATTITNGGNAAYSQYIYTPSIVTTRRCALVGMFGAYGHYNPAAPAAFGSASHSIYTNVYDGSNQGYLPSMMCIANNMAPGTYQMWAYASWLTATDAGRNGTIIALSSTNSTPNTPTGLQRTGAQTDTTPNFQASISDPDTGQQIKARFEVWNSTMTTQLGTVDSAFRTGDGTVTAEYASALAVGTYNVRALTIDDSGASSGTTAFVQFKVTSTVSEDSTYLWNIKQFVPVDRTLLWDTNANNIIENTFLWNILNPRDPIDATFLWGINTPWANRPLDDDDTSSLWTEVLG